MIKIFPYGPTVYLRSRCRHTPTSARQPNVMPTTSRVATVDRISPPAFGVSELQGPPVAILSSKLIRQIQAICLSLAKGFTLICPFLVSMRTRPNHTTPRTRPVSVSARANISDLQRAEIGNWGSDARKHSECETSLHEAALLSARVMRSTWRNHTSSVHDSTVDSTLFRRLAVTHGVEIVPQPLFKVVHATYSGR